MRREMRERERVREGKGDRKFEEIERAIHLMILKTLFKITSSVLDMLKKGTGKRR